MNIVVVAEAFLFKMKGRVARARDPMLAQVGAARDVVCVLTSAATELFSPLDRQV